MSTNYPNSVDSYTAKVDNVTEVMAADINNLQDATIAIENDVIAHKADNATAHAVNTKKLKNWIINGMFDVWQRGTSQTTTGYGSDDRWINSHSVSSKTHSQQTFTVGQSTVPNNPTYFSRTVVTTGGTSASWCMKNQNIEDVTKLAGKTFTLSFWAKADSSKNLSVEFSQVFGSGGSATINGLSVSKITLSSVWARYTLTVTLPSISGQILGTGHCTQLTFWFDGGSNFNSRTNSLGNQSGTFDIANVSLVEGTVAQECENEPFGDVLLKCKRYYEKSYDLNTALGTVTGNGFFNFHSRDSIAASTAGILRFGIVHFEVSKRIAPTVIIYSTNGSANAVRINETSADRTGATAVNIGEKGFSNINISNAGTVAINLDDKVDFHWTADAEL